MKISRDRIYAHACGGEARGDGSQKADGFSDEWMFSVIMRQRNDAVTGSPFASPRAGSA